MKKCIYFLCMLFTSSLLLFSCNSSNSDTSNPESTKAPTISNNGETIIIEKGSTNQIASMQANKQGISSDIKAPCKIVLSAVRSGAYGSNSYLYESTELSDLIGERAKTKTSIDKTARIVERLKDLVAHHASPVKDLLDAQADLAQLRTSFASMDDKLIVMGLNPRTSLNIPSGKVLAIGDFPESQVAKLKNGEEVTVVFNSFPNEKFQSKISGIGGVIDPLTRTMKVQVILDNKSGKLVPGLYGQMLLSVDEESALAVPSNSVFTAKGKSFLFVETNPCEYHRREVLTGVTNNDYVEILSGVQPGEKVVTKGIVLLKALSFGY